MELIQAIAGIIIIISVIGYMFYEAWKRINQNG